MPIVALPPVTLFTDHVTAVLLLPLTVAENCWVPFVYALAVFGEIVTETGTGAVTVTVASALALTPLPLQVRVYFVVAVGDTFALPLMATVPDQLLSAGEAEAVAEVALVQLPVNVAELPLTIVVGDALMVAVGAGVKPPPPVPPHPPNVDESRRTDKNVTLTALPIQINMFFSFSLLREIRCKSVIQFRAKREASAFPPSQLLIS